jgi:hypothetical protein
MFQLNSALAHYISYDIHYKHVTKNNISIFLHSKAAAISSAFCPALLLQGCVTGVLKIIVNLNDLAMKFRLKNNKLLIYCNQKLKLI